MDIRKNLAKISLEKSIDKTGGLFIFNLILLLSSAWLHWSKKSLLLGNSLLLAIFVLFSALLSGLILYYVFSYFKPLFFWESYLKEADSLLKKYDFFLMLWQEAIPGIESEKINTEKYFDDLNNRLEDDENPGDKKRALVMLRQYERTTEEIFEDGNLIYSGLQKSKSNPRAENIYKQQKNYYIEEYYEEKDEHGRKILFSTYFEIKSRKEELLIELRKTLN